MAGLGARGKRLKGTGAWQGVCRPSGVWWASVVHWGRNMCSVVLRWSSRPMPRAGSTVDNTCHLPLCPRRHFLQKQLRELNLLFSRETIPNKLKTCFK